MEKANRFLEGVQVEPTPSSHRNQARTSSRVTLVDRGIALEPRPDIVYSSALSAAVVIQKQFKHISESHCRNDCHKFFFDAAIS